MSVPIKEDLSRKVLLPYIYFIYFIFFLSFVFINHDFTNKVCFMFFQLLHGII